MHGQCVEKTIPGEVFMAWCSWHSVHDRVARVTHVWRTCVWCTCVCCALVWCCGVLPLSVALVCVVAVRMNDEPHEGAALIWFLMRRKRHRKRREEEKGGVCGWEGQRCGGGRRRSIPASFPSRGVLASYRSERQISIKMSSFHIFYGRHEASTLRKVIITANTFANRVR